MRLTKEIETKIDSKVNSGALSPQSMKERLRKIIQDQNQLRRKNVQLAANHVIDDANKEFTDNDTTLALFRKTCLIHQAIP
jgi:hypothetical protein